MKLRERFHRLTLWNKLAAIGSFASILGILVTVLFWWISPDPISHPGLQEETAVLRNQAESYHTAESAALERLQRSLDSLTSNRSLMERLEAQYSLGFGLLTTDGKLRTFYDNHASDIRFDWSQFKITHAGGGRLTFDPPKIKFLNAANFNLDMKQFTMLSNVGSYVNWLTINNRTYRAEILKTEQGILAFVFGVFTETEVD